MSHYHVVIQTERRQAPRKLALPMNNDLQVQTGTDQSGMPVYQVTPRPPQLHAIGEALNHQDDANITYAAEWDGVSPWIVVHKGSIADLRMAYAGWPMVTREEWEAANPPLQP
jgi:hypothetical protein